MNLKKIPPTIPIYGDTSFRGRCPLEDSETASFVQWVKYQYPEYENITTHVKNEGKRGHWAARNDKSMGLTQGFADVIIASTPAFALEMKRQDHTKSKIGDGQIEHLLNVIHHGGFACFALNFDGAKQAFIDYLEFKGETNG